MLNRLFSGGKDFLPPRGIDPGWELIVDELVGDEVHKLREKVEFVEQLGENAQEVKEHLNERLAVAEEELNEIGEKAKNEIREGLSHYRWEQLPAWFGPKPTEDRA